MVINRHPDNTCGCGGYKAKVVGKCTKCVKYELFGSKEDTFCECGNRISEEQLTRVGVCKECM